MYDLSLIDKNLSHSVDSNQLPRHRWYPYKEGFSPSLVTYAINSTNFKKDSLLLDPFNGSGTVSLYAAQAGYICEAHEVNPFSSFISNCKQLNITPKRLLKFQNDFGSLLNGSDIGAKSPLVDFSTFSEKEGKEKWLFNSDVLSAFQGGFNQLNLIKDKDFKMLYKLALISSAMENCNAKKDGKCLRYKANWQELNYNKETFLNSFQHNLNQILVDLSISNVYSKPKIRLGDTRLLSSKLGKKFSLCITSPPYLNSFDYTDIYRPELFLGGFLKNQNEFLEQKHKTIRSHILTNKIQLPNEIYGYLFTQTITLLKSQSITEWDKKTIIMVKSYFNDMMIVLRNLKTQVMPAGEIWLVVANSAYMNVEIQTDLILVEMASRLGWRLKQICVLRYIHKRGTKYSPDIKILRESVVVLTA